MMIGGALQEELVVARLKTLLKQSVSKLDSAVSVDK